MDHRRRRESSPHKGLLEIEDVLDADGRIVLPPEDTLISVMERNVACVGDAVAFRYLDHTSPAGVRQTELTWAQLDLRMRAIGARLQRSTARGDRVAILAPQGLDYVAGFYAAVKIGTIAVPLFAPELPGHAERLETALRDATPTVVLTTASALETVAAFLLRLPQARRPEVIVIDSVPDSAAVEFTPVELKLGDVSHLQYTSGATRSPIGVEVTHRSVGTNLLQMILSINLLDRNIHGLSWLPLYHDMGLSMIGFPAVYGGHSTLMSPTAFIRRPQRWIEAISAQSRHGRVVTAAPNFAYELTAQRGLPAPDTVVDLSNVVMIIGSEPVSMAAISAFNDAFARYGLPRTAIKPSYGIAEATLFVSTIEPDAEPTAVHLDRRRLNAGHAVRVADEDPDAVTHVSCGRIARSQWAVVVDRRTGAELPDGRVGEIWLHGDNITRGYWGQPGETGRTFGAELTARLAAGSHAHGAPEAATWLRTGDLGVYLDGELFVTGRIADLVTIDGHEHYPQDIEATVARASSAVRAGYAVAFSVPAGELPGDGAFGAAGDHLVIVAERAMGTRGVDLRPVAEEIGAAVQRRHGVPVFEVRFLPAGGIPRTTSGKLGRVACRAEYVGGTLVQR
ncbi:MAG TPA: fatty acyl-AMP ligase [Mycobacterium sp.]